jgi:hypothetical protein
VVCLDRELIFRARRLTTGANVHKINTLLFQYQQAVALHNEGHAKYRSYPDVFERKLRELVTRNIARIMRRL